MSSLHPRPPYSDAELASLYPPQLRLLMVQIFLRHGERTPLVARFREAGLSAFWPYCSSVNRMRSAVLDADADDDDGNNDRLSDLKWKRQLETLGPGSAPIPAAGPDGRLDSVCDLGMLTDLGRESTLQLGRRLRRLYVDRLAFLPPRIADGETVHLRSTSVTRALESMLQVFEGLYPPRTRSPGFRPPMVVSRLPEEETLFPNDFSCPRLAVLTHAFSRRAAGRWNRSDEMDYLNCKIGRWMPADSPRVAVDSRPRLTGIMDTINASAAHGPLTRLPADFYHPTVKTLLERICLDEFFAGYRESREYRTLGIGALLGDVVARMLPRLSDDGSSPSPSTSAPSSSLPARFALSGCHDTTLAAFLASLGALNTNAWPPFSSHLAVELFARSDPSPAAQAPPADRLDHFFVRLRYNDEPVTIPACRLPGNHLDGNESFCTLKAFKAVVDDFTPRDWKRQCLTRLAAPAFPDRPEPAGY